MIVISNGILPDLGGLADDNKEQKTVIIYNLQGQMIDRLVTHDNKIGINVPRQVVVMKIICGSNVLTKKLLMK